MNRDRRLAEAAALARTTELEALQAWLREAGITTGPVFRAIDQWGNVGRRALTPPID